MPHKERTCSLGFAGTYAKISSKRHFFLGGPNQVGRRSQRMAGRPPLILVDTTVWIDFFNGNETPEKHALETLSKKSALLCLTDIVLTEILRGITKDDDYVTVKKALRPFPCLSPRPVETYIHAAELYRQCRGKGFTVRSTVDCLIAAVCIEYKVPLLHHDADFEHLARCTSLRTIDPAAIIST